MWIGKCSIKLFAKIVSLGQMFTVNESFNAANFAKNTKTTPIHANEQNNDERIEIFIP